MSLPESFRGLARQFEQAHARWPELRHVLVEATDEAKSGSIQMASSIARRDREIVRQIPYTRGLPLQDHAFYGLTIDKDGGREAFPELRRLATVAVKLLVDCGKLPVESAPDDNWPIAVENHWAARLMVFVHRLAQEDRSGVLLRAERKPVSNGYRLPKGTTASELPFGAFKASGLAMEIVASDMEQAGIGNRLVPDTSPLGLLIRRFDELAWYAQAYYFVVGSLPYVSVIHDVASELENRIATLARTFLDASNDVKQIAAQLDPYIIPRAAKREIESFETTLKAQMTRWKWGFVLEPDGLATIKAKLDAHFKNRRIPFLRACLAWRSMPGLEAHENADDAADEAAKRHLKPARLPHGTSPEAAKDLTFKLHQSWLVSPALGRKLPTIDEEERTLLGRSADAISRAAHAFRLSHSNRLTPEPPVATPAPATMKSQENLLSLSALQTPSRADQDLGQNTKQKPHRRGGRPSDTDPDEDRRIDEAWATKRYASLEALANAMGKTTREVRQARDRHRKRVGKTSSWESCQGD